MIEKISDLNLSFTKDLEPTKPKKTDFSFHEVIKNTINKVSEMQTQNDHMINSFLLGESIDLHNIMISLEKTNISFRLITEIRNKALSAYEEIMKMPI
jgi:flagellar hook-basal body complex protein FliE